MRWNVILSLTVLSALLAYLDSDRNDSKDLRNLRLASLQGTTYSLADLTAKGPVVLVFVTSECPAVPRYAPRLNQMYAAFQKQGVSFVGVYSNADETPNQVKDHAKRMGFRFLVVIDRSGELATRLGASRTPQAVVLDKSGKVRYSGAIDSAAKQEQPQHTYLKDALESLLKGKSVRVARTEVVGCFLRLARDEAAPTAVTFAEHVAPILYEQCTPCHRPGNIGPFPLQSYEDAKRWAQEIKYYTQRRAMPPWKPEHSYGEFRGERRLTDEQIALIAKWVDAGAPAGDMGHAPKVPTYNNEWEMEQPDLIAEMPEAYEVSGTGADEYRYFVIPVEVPPGTYMEGIDIKPGSRDVVHHANVYVDLTGSARKLDAADPKPGYSNFGSPGFIPALMLGGWVPGMRPMRLDAGYGVLLPQKFDLVLQIHYFKGKGITARDRTKVGLYFSRQQSVKPVQLVVIGNTRFSIPPGEARHEVRGQWQVPADHGVKAVAIMAHLHLLAREVQVTAETPDKQPIPLLWIKDYDFNWQETYFYKKPVELPAGTVVRAVGYYDNTEKNPRNPNRPPKEVRYGDKTTDEMFYIFMAIVDEKAKGSFLIPATGG